MFIQKVFNKYKFGQLVSLQTFKSLSVLVAGTFLSAIIPIILSPLMTRIFTRHDYGVLGLYMSISGLLGVLAYSHYPQAIMLEKEDKDAWRVLCFSIFICIVFGLGTMLILTAMYFFTSVLQHSVIGGWCFFIPLSIFLNGVSSILMVWANRIQQYRVLAINRIFQALATVIIQIVLGILMKDEVGLLAGFIFGQVLGVVLLVLSGIKNDLFLKVSRELDQLKFVAGRYRKFLFFTTPTEFVNNLINQTPIFLLQRYGGLSYVGSYNFTQRFLGLPQQFLSSAIIEVFKQKSSASFVQIGNCKEVFLKTLKVLFLIAIVPFSLIALFSPPAFSFLFGAEWREAGVFAQYLSILFFCRFVISPLTYVYYVAGKLREDFFLNMLLLIVATLSFYVGNELFHDKKYLILAYAIAYSGIYVIFLFRSYQLSKGHL
jgi:O-antigen/teichoic acid export membrane protein